jgi:hypothetical protein
MKSPKGAYSCELFFITYFDVHKSYCKVRHAMIRHFVSILSSFGDEDEESTEMCLRGHQTEVTTLRYG